jgi:mono/diheme cytochrome c family protein
MAAPKKTPDRHYNFEKLNKWFAWSSLALLVITVWMVVEDYAKPWKRLQAEFRELERQKLVSEADAERQRLDQAQLAQLQEEIAAEEARLAEQSAEVAELESRRADLDDKVYEADVKSRTTKSHLDTERYLYDAALQTGNESKIEKALATLDERRAQYQIDRVELESFTEQRAEVDAELTRKRAGVSDAEKRLAALRSGVESLEVRVAGLGKTLDYFVLNAPLMDMLEPTLKIEQVQLPGLYQNINFTNVDRVDRCVTCHVASVRTGFDGEEWAEPFRSHPRLDLFLSSSSPHPYSEFGCTTCHSGLDRATNFARVGHSPESEEQKAEWKKEWGWKKQKYLDTPILPAKYSEAGCISCHAGNVWTPGSQLQDTGRELMSRMGCFACHKIDYPAFTDLPRPGPSLRKVASKTSPEWAYKWIEAPRDFHPTTWMPHFFFQENIVGELNEERQRAEIRATVAYIWDESEAVEYPAPPSGSSERGEALFNSVGCTGCHIRDADAKRDDFFPQINRMHGPNLVRTGSKVDAGWLYAWLKNPSDFSPETRMPSLRLTDQEAADLVAYLMESRDPAFENLEMPDVDGEVRDELVMLYLQNTQTIAQSQATLDGMTENERDVYLGKETIRKYGCFGCHEVNGFDDAKPIGVELTEEGSKPVHQFDFGHIHDIPHTRHDWIKTKMLRPRIWDHGKEQVKDYGELYRMPNFGMSEQEAEAVVANVLGFTKAQVLTHRQADQMPEADALAQGRKLITVYNCRACHLVEGQGQAIKTAIEDPGMWPPNLASQGVRVQGDWLFDYLHDPSSEAMRPWLSVRMPTFGFDDDRVNTLISYFSSRDGSDAYLSPPEHPDQRSLAVGAGVFAMLQCAKCHPAGDIQPGQVSASELAPSLLLAPDRLRHDWVADWVKDPLSFVTGTKMPVFFSRQDDGSYSSPMAQGIDAPMWSSEKSRMMRHFESEEALKEYLADADKVTAALRDHIWWNL